MRDRDQWQTSVPADAHPKVRALHDYWNAKRGDRPFPSRADIDPAEIPGLLQHLSLIEIRPSEPRFVYRLAGTEVARLLQQDPTGKPVGEGVQIAERGAVMARYAFVADQAGCVFHAATLQEQRNDFSRVQRLMLPLGPPSGPPTMIVSLVVQVG